MVEGVSSAKAGQGKTESVMVKVKMVGKGSKGSKAEVPVKRGPGRPKGSSNKAHSHSTNGRGKPTPIQGNYKNGRDTSKYAPKSRPMSNNGRSVKADEPIMEPRWTKRRMAIIKAMRKLKAVSEQSARTAQDIGRVAGVVDGVDLEDRIDYVKIALDVYRTTELVHNGFVKTTRFEGERYLRYYLTKKGMTTEFPGKEDALAGKRKRRKKEDIEDQEDTQKTTKKTGKVAKVKPPVHATNGHAKVKGKPGRKPKAVVTEEYSDEEYDPTSEW